MKKVHLLMCAGFAILSLLTSAQTVYLSEGFESWVPAGWALYKQGTGLSKHWSQTNSAAHSGQNSAYHEYRTTAQNAWLVSPSFNLTSASYPTLNYWDAVLYRDYAEEHLVLVSTTYVTGQNPWNYQWDTLSSMIGSNYWQHAGNIPLLNYLAGNVHIAWLYKGTNAANWYIDDVFITEAGIPPVNDDCSTATLLDGPFPESLTDSNTWAKFDCTEHLNFFNGTWYEISLPNACNTVEITLTGLEASLTSTGIILTTDCSCSAEGFIYADSSQFTSDTSVYLLFNGIAGPIHVYLPVSIEPLQAFNLVVDVTSACLAPGAPEVISFTENSVDLSWSLSNCATEYEIEYGLYGFEPMGVPTVTGITAVPFSLTELEPGQCYQCYIRSVCSATQYSPWSDTLAFCTSCPAAIDSFQYLCNYEAPVWPPNCWTVNSTSSTTWVYGYTLQSPATNLTFCGYSTTENQDEWLITPTIDLTSISEPFLAFDWMTSYEWMVDSNFADVRLLISLDDGLTWQPDELFSEDGIGPFQEWDWNFYNIDLSGYSGEPQVKFAFVYTGFNGDAFALDNFMVGPFQPSTSWTGAANSDWFNLGNWSSFVPFEGCSVSIPDVSSTTRRYPILNNSAHCYDLVVEENASLIVQQGTSLHALQGTRPTDHLTPAAKTYQSTQGTRQERVRQNDISQHSASQEQAINTDVVPASRKAAKLSASELKAASGR